MTNASRDKGTAWETAVVRYLQGSGWPHAERRARRGVRDAGDVAGVAGVCIEAKAEKRITLAEYITEAETERVNADAALGVAWIKRPRKASPADGYVVMTGSRFIELLKAAGY